MCVCLCVCVCVCACARARVCERHETTYQLPRNLRWRYSKENKPLLCKEPSNSQVPFTVHKTYQHTTGKCDSTKRLGLAQNSTKRIRIPEFTWNTLWSIITGETQSIHKNFVVKPEEKKTISLLWKWQTSNIKIKLKSFQMDFFCKKWRPQCFSTCGRNPFTINRIIQHKNKLNSKIYRF